MLIDIITVVPDILKSSFEASILNRVIDKNIVEVYTHFLRDYTDLRYN